MIMIEKGDRYFFGSWSRQVQTLQQAMAVQEFQGHVSLTAN